MIIHLDADAFYASVEQVENPALRGKAMAVGGLHRGIIASATYEARARGVLHADAHAARAEGLSGTHSRPGQHGEVCGLLAADVRLRRGVHADHRTNLDRRGIL
jgi:nucleotidyltransferase/DNA polymerase involved in DNA repair